MIGSELKRVLAEALIVVIVGAILGLGANLLSPRGLSIGRNYFPAANRAGPGVGAKPPAGAAHGVEGSNPAGEATLAARFQAKGLQLISHAQAKELFQDPGYRQELIVFVDARNDHSYQEGHIPGAYQFDRYYPEKYLPEVLPACLNAAKVVVYCSGGQCEDSEFAAVALREAGVTPANLFVYAGGISTWATNGLPMEVGGRHSGQRQETPP